MKNHLPKLFCTILVLATTLPVMAQVAGSTTTVDISVAESTQATMGWSVKKSLMGKTLYNDAGDKVGKVKDLIISPDKSVSYVIIGAGGFIGIGQHDVAIPVTKIQDKAGKLVMVGASKEAIKAMPAFNYATDTTRRTNFIATAEKEIARGKATVTDLEKKATTATIDAKVQIDAQITTLQADLKTADAKLVEMKQATDERWKEFETSVSTALTRLNKSITATR